MGDALPRTMMDRDQYLRWEAEQPERHEYLAGEIFAMVGVRREHALVTLALGSLLRQRLKGSPCQAFVADMKLRVDAADAYFYPDVMVTCDPRDRSAETAIAHPCLVIEVLSDSTAAFDRGQKFAAYRRLESLREYLLVDIEARRLELYRREGAHWLLLETRADGSPLLLDSVGVALDPSDAFEDLDPPRLD
ncbi:Uma2 family endonuclease [Thioalkalivibrio sp.]|uniref:Uma2 family endonuclease n=1 Tax=Thioalkalivibrio sp. TaxID=2093813 RepID=UPI0039753EAA